MDFKKNKVYILSVLIIVIAVPFIFKIFFSLRYSNDAIRNELDSVIKDSLNRAVQFEDAYIDYSGNIILSPLNLSVSNDFNDNLSLVKSRELVIDLDFIDLLMGRITVRGFKIENADIRILKSYGKDYRDAFAQLIDLGSRIKTLARKKKVDFKVTLDDCTIYYDEIFKDEKTTVIFKDVYSSVSIDGESVKYSFKTTVPLNRNKNLGNGKFRMDGRVFDTEALGYSHKLSVDNLDLSYMSRYAPEISPYPLAFKGGVTAGLALTKNKGTYSIRGDIETDNLHVYTGTGVNHQLISNENINLDIDFSADPEHGTYVMKKMKLYDDIMKITARGSYRDNESANIIEGSIESNTIDLEDLAHCFMPLENHYYSGELSFNGKILYDIKNNDAGKSVFDLNLDEFMLMDITKGAEKVLISEGNMNINLKGGIVTSDFKGTTAGSDYRLAMKSSVTSWNPLKTVTEASLRSKKIELSLLKRVTGNLLDRAVKTAYDDSLTGYEDVMFLQKPVSQYFINNDIALDCSAGLITVSDVKKTSGFKDFSLSLEMKKGVLALKDFSLSGYGAAYELDIQGYFASDYPHCTMNGSARDFDLELLSKDMAGLNLSGKAAFTFDYALNIYRIAHILENSSGNATLSVSRGSLSRGPLLSGIKNLLQTGGYKISADGGLTFAGFSIMTQQTGEIIYLRNMSLSGEGMNLNLAGKYTFRGGLDLTGSGTVSILEKRGDVEIPLNVYVPVWMQGPLSAPCATVKIKTGKPYCF